MTRRGWFVRWRWWHVVAGLLIGAAPIVITLLCRLEVALINSPGMSFKSYNRYAQLIEWGVSGALLFPLLWVIVVTPWLESANPRFTEKFPARTRLKYLRFTAWTPFVLTAGVILVLFLDAGLDWLRTSVWQPMGLSSPWLWGILLGAFSWGWGFGRLVARRLRATFACSGVCYHCSYSLTGLPPGQRCPECGRPTAAAAPQA